MVKRHLWIVNNRRNISLYHQDFMASTHSDFFQGQMDGGLFYWPILRQMQFLLLTFPKMTMILQTMRM